MHCNKEQSLLIATRESPCTTTKTHYGQRKINEYNSKNETIERWMWASIKQDFHFQNCVLKEDVD